MRAYVTGGTGFVGSNIVKVFAENHGATVHCPVNRFVPDETPGYTTETLDLLDAGAVGTSVGEFDPDVIVHSMILNEFGLMYSERERAWRSFVDTTCTLADAANECGAKLVLVSTDWVYDGTQSRATETTPPNPVNYYGVLKLASETAALNRADRVAVARVSGVNGVHWARPESPRAQDPGFGYFVASMVDSLSAGEEFGVWESEEINMIATPSLASECGELMWLMAANENATGVFHCCGSDATSRMELAELACDVFELDSGLLRSESPEPAAMLPAPVPYDTTLAVTRTAEILGSVPLTAREILGRFRDQVTTGTITTGAA